MLKAVFACVQEHHCASVNLGEAFPYTPYGRCFKVDARLYYHDFMCMKNCSAFNKTWTPSFDHMFRFIVIGNGVRHFDAKTNVLITNIDAQIPCKSMF